MEIRTDPSRLKPLVIGNKVFRSSEDYEISSEDEELARRELNETKDVRDTCLRDLKERLTREGVKCRTDDAYLLSFLRCKKFNCDEAYKRIDFCYSIRREHPEIFNTLPSNLEELLDINMFVYLPYRDEDGSILFVDKFGKWDPRKLTTYNLLQLFQPIADVMTLRPSCQINKIVGIVDFKNTYPRHFSSVLGSVRFVLNVWQNMYTWRIKHIIFLNCHPLAYATFKGIRYLLKKKIADRIIIIGSDMSQLHEYINPAILPKEYGGSLEERECSITKHILNNLPYIKYEHSFYNTEKNYVVS